MSAVSGPSLKYPGAKWGSQGSVARWITAQLPNHTTYVEPFFGSGAVFFTKKPSTTEYINDIDGDVVNLFRVLRDQPDALARLIDLTPYARAEQEISFEQVADPLERARRTLIRHWMTVAGDGGVNGISWRHSGPNNKRAKSCSQEWDNLPARLYAHAKRLKLAHIENRPALELLGRLNHPHTLAYIDPPYLAETRKGRRYRHEMLKVAEHEELLAFLLGDWQGMALVSGYAHPLYDDLLNGWTRFTRSAQAESGQSREEVLWISPSAANKGLWA